MPDGKDRPDIRSAWGMIAMQRKYIPIALANYIPVLCAFLFFRNPNLAWLLFIISQIWLTISNYKAADSKFTLAFFQVNLLISTMIANTLLTHLYYSKISSDSETLAVGNLVLVLGAVFVLILSLISILLKKEPSE